MNENETHPVMYIFINKELGMSPGKMAAQAAHAACCAQRVSDDKLVDDWYKYGFYTKLVMEARDAQHLAEIEKYLSERGIKSVPIIDEGYTEIPKHSRTALGVEVVDKKVHGPIFQEFSLFKPELNIKIRWD